MLNIFSYSTRFVGELDDIMNILHLDATSMKVEVGIGSSKDMRKTSKVKPTHLTSEIPSTLVTRGVGVATRT